eukprot:5099226-Amphidinium_carterae.2
MEVGFVDDVDVELDDGVAVGVTMGACAAGACACGSTVEDVDLGHIAINDVHVATRARADFMVVLLPPFRLFGPIIWLNETRFRENSSASLTLNRNGLSQNHYLIQLRQ